MTMAKNLRLRMACDTPPLRDTMVPARDGDAELLKAIGQRRDRAAFAEILRRYKGNAFSLATRLLHDSTLAEDAVQEAMLNIWMSANRFRLEHDARGWILRIVANTSLTLLRNQSRRASREERAARAHVVSEDTDALATETREAIALLRIHLDQLPKLESQILACCYGASLSHQRIAELFSMSRTRVTERIQTALARLRAQLKQAGVSAVAPVLSLKTLQAALTSGFELPPSISEKILERIEGTGKGDSGTRPDTGSLLASPSLTAGLAIFVAATGALWWKGSNWDSGTEKAPGTPERSAPTQSVARQNRFQPLYACWNFQDGPPTDLPLFQGKWIWRRVGGVGCMEPSGTNREVYVLLPMRLPAKKLGITMRVISQNGLLQLAPMWVNQRQILPRLTWEADRLRVDSPSGNLLKVFSLDEYLISEFNSQTALIMRYEKAFPSDRLVLGFKGWRVTSIEVFEIPEGDPALRSLDPKKKIEEILRNGCHAGSLPSNPLDWKAIPAEFR